MIPLLAKAAQSSVVKKGALALGIVTVFGVGYFVISRKIRKNKEAENRKNEISYLSNDVVDVNVSNMNTIDKQAFYDKKKKGVLYAQRFKAAFGYWLGTDLGLIWDTLKLMKDQKVSINIVASAYNNLYKEDFFKRLEGELNTREIKKYQGYIEGINGINGEYVEFQELI